MLQGVTMAAVQQARVAAGFLPPCDDGEHVWALNSHAGNDDGCWYPYYDCAAARSDLTCKGGSGDKVVVQLPSLKRGREDDDDLARYSSTAALLPIPGMQMQHEAPPRSTVAWGDSVTTTRMAQSATASTSGRSATTSPVAASVEDALVAEMCGQQSAEVDAVVRAWCDRLRAGLERARKRRCVALVRAASAMGAAARVLRDRGVELAAARRRAAELEERLRQAEAESQAWRDVARGNEAVAAGLRATLETLLLGGGALAMPATKVEEEGFGDSGDQAAAAADDARSCCFVEAEAGAAAAASSAAAVASRWECRACGGGEASVLLLPCRHLCLCKACEPRADACPVCVAAKTGAIHVAAG